MNVFKRQFRGAVSSSLSAPRAFVSSSSFASSGTLADGSVRRKARIEKEMHAKETGGEVHFSAQ